MNFTEPVSAQPTTIAEEIKSADAVTSQPKEGEGESKEEGSEATAGDGEKTQVAKGINFMLFSPRMLSIRICVCF